MERDSIGVNANFNMKHFNSHAHVERDCNVATLKFLFVISTHTLTWSVTDLGECTFFTKFISTHTLTWSVTDISFDVTTAHTISTHTLTWSVTCRLVKI